MSALNVALNIFLRGVLGRDAIPCPPIFQGVMRPHYFTKNKCKNKAYGFGCYTLILEHLCI